MPKAKVTGVLGLDPTLPDVKLTIAGKTYQLCFDFNACAQVQSLTGVNVFASPTNTDLDPIKFRAQLWASLLRDQPEITIEEVGKLITPKTMKAIAEAVAAAWTESQAEPDPGNE